MYLKYPEILNGFFAVRKKNENNFIPNDPANTDYQEYLKWLAEGNEPEPADEEE